MKYVWSRQTKNELWGKNYANLALSQLTFNFYFQLIQAFNTVIKMCMVHKKVNCFGIVLTKAFHMFMFSKRQLVNFLIPYQTRYNKETNTQM